jgi:L-ascorbate oxidase
MSKTMPFIDEKHQGIHRSSMRLGAIVAASLWGSSGALAGAFVEPPVFASSKGVLDLMIIALAQPVPSISYVTPSGPVINPTGWVYQICPRASATGNECPAGSPTTSYYGGIRLALQQGDKLTFRLVNQLPAFEYPAMLAFGTPDLLLNPTNIHTHGLIVPARAPTLSDPTFGDDIFVDIYNPSNGTPEPPPPETHQHGSVVMGFADYRIDIPANHPSGAFWFHPHVHGISGNQLSSGLAGIISVGHVGDYAFGDVNNLPFPEANVRHLVLKDMQVLASAPYPFQSSPPYVPDGTVLNQQAGTFDIFCTQDPAEVRQGSCPGTGTYENGTWFFTVSGQQFPTIQMTEANGEIWRLTNASANVTYDLQLISDATGMPMITQLVSVDGVSIDVPTSTAPGTVMEIAGARFTVVTCPPAPPEGLTSVPVCISDFVMMPSSRAELWVTYRDANGNVVTPPAGATGTFKTIGITTGPTNVGDAWPAVDLAKVAFDQTGPRLLAAFVLALRGDALKSNQPTGIFFAPVPYAKAAAVPPNCNSLAPGHRRRIFFGLVGGSGAEGLGYEEIDQLGAVVPGTQMPVTAFDPSVTTVCLPLGPGQTPVRETWEIVNLANQSHNFHIHQTKFSFIQPGAPPQSLTSYPFNQNLGVGIMEDNVPLPIVTVGPTTVIPPDGSCTILQWHNRGCTMTPLVVDIPFSQLGAFVYHCHILNHEDSGMMAKIQVVPSPR